MGKRTRDEVIYSRVDYRVKQEFESQTHQVLRLLRISLFHLLLNTAS